MGALPIRSEKDHQRVVVDALTTLGYLTYHTYDSRRSNPGFPDLVAVHPGKGRRLFVELKTATGKLTADQLRWLGALALSGGDVHVVRPRDVQEFIDWAQLDAAKAAEADMLERLPTTHVGGEA